MNVATLNAELLCQITIALQRPRHAHARPVAESENQDNDILRQQEHQKADVRPFLAEQLPEFVAEL
jgi:hypothetical protein